MAALHSRCGHYIFVGFVLFPLSFFLFFLAYSQRLQIGYLPYFYTWCGPRLNLECRSEMCCTRLAANAGPKKSPSGHHRTTLSGYIFTTKTCIDNQKKLVKQPYLPHMSSQYDEFRPTSGWDPFGSLGHPSKFQRVSCLGSITARHSSSGRQPNFVALNRGRHLYSALGRAAITLGIAPHSSCWYFSHYFFHIYIFLFCLSSYLLVPELRAVDISERRFVLVADETVVYIRTSFSLYSHVVVETASQSRLARRTCDRRLQPHENIPQVM